MIRLSSIAEAVQARFSVRAVQRNLTINVDPDLVLGGDVEVDKPRMLATLGYVVDNAVKYAYRGTSIDIQQVQSGNLSVTFAIADVGDRIRAEHIRRVFDKGFRAEESRSFSGQRGSGLGLYYAKLIVEAHGGQIWCTSEPEKLYGGRGYRTTFYLALPRRQGSRS